ncbi:hypothetical protein DSO57_1017301 [Entomophthora muscae]|uniref:Uncharacterized protein n=1 Tax=Entomophthora muscae TaxID=34485 RepID=A0ACC2RJC6_9FUNG|nr:hypothetical protein DSO57_1017301 [Entomophthora muscae]
MPVIGQTMKCLSIITLLTNVATSATIPSQSTLLHINRSIDQAPMSIPTPQENTQGSRPFKVSHLSNPENSYVPAKPLIPLDDNMEPIQAPGLAKKKSPSLFNRIIGRFQGTQTRSEANPLAVE